MYALGDTLSPDQAMGMAIEVAKQGRGFVSPNPLVGCVILDKNRRLMAWGAHLKYGGPHAEINALTMVNDKKQLEGASLYVTLEPCSHQGKTGSCAQVLCQLPLAKVVYAVKDPNPLVAGQGLQIIQNNNIVVEQLADFESPVLKLCEQFIYHIQKRSPFVAIKVATSFDGIMALKDGSSQWITGEKARLEGRFLRACYDATMIGAGTFLYDDPTLNFRGTEFDGTKDNKIILVDPKGKGAEFFSQSRVGKHHDKKNIFVLTRKDHIEAWAKHLVHVIEWTGDPGSWRQALKNLYQKDIYSIYCEGGSYVFGQLLRHGLAQKIYHFQAPKILGDGVSWTQALEISKMDQALLLQNHSFKKIADDTLSEVYFTSDLS